MAGAGLGGLKTTTTPIATHEIKRTSKRRERKVDGWANSFIKDEYCETSAVVQTTECTGGDNQHRSPAPLGQSRGPRGGTEKRHPALAGAILFQFGRCA